MYFDIYYELTAQLSHTQILTMKKKLNLNKI